MAVKAVHDTGCGESTIAQCGRAFQNFNAIGVKQADRIGVVAARGRDIANRHAVLHHVDTIATQPANDRLADSRAETGIADTRQFRQNIANRAIHLRANHIVIKDFSC